jgi:hypothetical protein
VGGTGASVAAIPEAAKRPSGIHSLGSLDLIEMVVVMDPGPPFGRPG